MTIKQHILNSSLYAIAAAIIISLAIFSYFLLAPVTVLQNWKISIANPQKTYAIGQQITLESIYTKTRDINGVAHRHLECTSGNVSNVSYPLSDAIADHPQGTRTGTGVIVTIPVIALPAVCKVAIDVSYKPYPFRTVTEYQSTSTFVVNN